VWAARKIFLNRALKNGVDRIEGWLMELSWSAPTARTCTLRRSNSAIHPRLLMITRAGGRVLALLGYEIVEVT
jgi:hypothetical protein